MRIASVLLCTLLTASFAASEEAIDPFDLRYARETSGPAQKITLFQKQVVDKVDISVKLTPEKALRGEVVKLTVQLRTKDGYYTYPLTRRAPDQEPTQLATMALAGEGLLKPLWPVREDEPEPYSTEGHLSWRHGKPFAWEQDFLVAADARPGPYTLDVNIDLMVCSDKNCTTKERYPGLQVAFAVAEGAAVTPSEATKTRLTGGPKVEVIEPVEKLANMRPLGGLLLFAFGSAFLMLLTPCVFPMIPITVNFFIKQSEREHHKPFLMASVYSGTIVVVLTFIMLVVGKVVIDLANNNWFNLAMGLLLIFFAFSLFGMYEIELPSFLVRYTSAREGQGGLLGAVFMAMTFTITSFTCTGPFLGFMFGSLAGARPPMLHLILAALVYSATFAAPFFALAFFPSMLKQLPKSGSWLNAVKVTMGFVELGAALKFLANADAGLHPGEPWLFNFDTTIAAWIALSFATALYLFGLFRLPHDDKVEHIGSLRMVIGTIFLGLSLYMVPALFGIKPAGFVGDQLFAFAPLRTGHATTGLSGLSPNSHANWHMDFQDAYKEAIATNKPIFIDFTSQNCPNCRLNESSVFPQPQVKAELDKFVKVQLYVDAVPDTKPNPVERGAQNKKWWEQFGELTLPLYIIWQPARDAPVDEQGNLKGSEVGRAADRLEVQPFVRLLQSARTRS